MNFKKLLMINSSFIKTIVFALSIISLVSCDTDYNSIGSDIIDDDVHYGMTKFTAPVTAYDSPTGAVQANNLPINMLGAFDNAVFGKTVAHFVTQVQLETAGPYLYEPVIDSVYLYVPYFSRIESTNSETGASTYTPDSIYGTLGAKFKLDVFRSGYFLRDSDPGSSFATGQKYFSNDKALIDASIVGGRLNNFSPEQNDLFAVTANEITRTAIPEGQTASKVVERFAPGIFLYFDKTEWQNIMFGAAASGKLTNNNVFKEYFRGLYFRVTQTGQSVMAMPRFNQGTITIKFRDYNPSTADDAVNGHTPEKFDRTLTLKLQGNTVNFFENTPQSGFSTAINNRDPLVDGVDMGDNRLYLKGGEGSMVFIDINEAALAALEPDPVTGERVLINEANLVFYIDKDAMAGAVEPRRILLYDVNNKRPLVDYYNDGSTAANQKYDKEIHGGLIEYSENRGLKYKIRITDHINNLINKDSTNVKLGLVVTEHINLPAVGALKETIFETYTSNGITSGLEVKTLPIGSVTHPFGTVLYGSRPDPDPDNGVPEDKRLKLEIYYTKPN